VPRRRTPPPIPELFLGLLALAVAAVWIAHVVAATIHDARHTRDTISITGSARKPITSDLVRWSLVVGATANTREAAARRLRRDAATLQVFLRRGGIPRREIAPAVVASETLVTELPKRRRLIRYRVSQGFDATTRRIDTVESVATRLAALIEGGIDVTAEPLAYISTDLAEAKLAALAAATAEARHRAEILVKGLGGRLGAMRSSTLGVYQITPRDSTEISDYGVNDTSSRDKDVTAVVTATFAVKR
jgi:uncharacterized protein